MSVYLKVKRAQFAIFYEKTRKEALKLAFAVVVTEAVMVGVFHLAVKYGIYEYFQPKTVTIEVARAAEIKTEEVKEEVKPAEKTNKELVATIHKNESANGTAKSGLHLTCKAKGMSNEYGYNPPTCYKDNATVEKLVDAWITDHKAQGMTDNQLLCHYATGTASNDCSYLKK